MASRAAALVLVRAARPRWTLTRIRRCARLVVLIANVADELLEQILEGHDAGQPTRCIAHDGEVSASAQHLEQEVIAVRGHARLGNGPQPNVAIGLLEYIEGVDHSDDGVERFPVDRNPAV